MTFLYGTNMELLYSQPAIAATIATTTSTCINTAATINPYQLPALQNIWSPGSMVGKGLMFLFAGGYNDTAAVESLSLTLALDSVIATPAASSVTVTTMGLCTVPTSATGLWEAQCWLSCVSVSNTASTWYMNGQVTVGPGNAEAALSTAFTYMWGGPTVTLGVPSPVTIATTIGYFPDLYSKWLGNGGCTIATTQMLVFGLN